MYGGFAKPDQSQTIQCRHKLTARLAEEIRKDVAIAIDGSEDENAVPWVATTPMRVQIGDTAPRKACIIMDIKLHAVCGIRGVIHSYDMTAASVHDLHYLKDVRWEYHDCMMLGDKGYLSTEIQKNLFEATNITLEVPYRLNQKNWRPPTRSRAMRNPPIPAKDL